MARRTEPEGEKEQARPTRVPVRLTPEAHDRLRELCLIRLKRPIEVVAGEWVMERLEKESRKLDKR